jgi:hypothetical protein
MFSSEVLKKKMLPIVPTIVWRRESLPRSTTNSDCPKFRMRSARSTLSGRGAQTTRAFS